MPVTLTVERNGRVTLTTFSEPLDMADIVKIQDRATQEVLSRATQTIYAVADFTGVTRLPPNVLSNARQLARQAHPMAGPMAIVVPNRFVNMMATTLSKLATKPPMHICETMDQAWVYIDQLLAAETASVKPLLIKNDAQDDVKRA